MEMHRAILIANENKSLCKKVGSAIVYWFKRTHCEDLNDITLEKKNILYMKFREFIQILDPESVGHSPQICRMMIQDIEMPINEFADKYLSMNFAELLPEKWENRLNHRRVAETIRNDFQGNSTKKCRKCGHRNTLVSLVQTRSADEGMTELNQCQNCGARWKG